MAWAIAGSIKGPQGDQGTAGPAGSAGATGARGSKWFTGTGAPGSLGGQLAGDMYLDTATGDFYTLA